MENPKPQKTTKLNNPYNHHQEKLKKEKMLKIFSNSFKPLIENAHKKFIEENLTPIVKKVEENRLNLLGKKSEF